jgi:hypothetical protein
MATQATRVITVGENLTGPFRRLGVYYHQEDPILYRGKQYPTVFHLYVCLHLLYVGAPQANVEYAEHIRKVKSVTCAACMGRLRCFPLNRDEDVMQANALIREYGPRIAPRLPTPLSMEVMFEQAYTAALQSCPRFAADLLSTERATIQYASKYTAAAIIASRVLMKIRDAALSNVQKKRVVETPPSPPVVKMDTSAGWIAPKKRKRDAPVVDLQEDSLDLPDLVDHPDDAPAPDEEDDDHTAQLLVDISEKDVEEPPPPPPRKTLRLLYEIDVPVPKERTKESIENLARMHYLIPREDGIEIQSSIDGDEIRFVRV